MPSLEFCLGLAALLFAPGPTNALLALAGAETGARRSLRLLPLVIAAYALTVLPLSVLGADLIGPQRGLRAGVTFAAALWVAWVAYGLWRRPAEQPASGSSARGLRLFIATLLNPKAFVIGLVLIPAEPQQHAALALFFAVLAVAAAAWAQLGAALRGRLPAGLPLIRRVCAGWLALLAALLVSAAVSA